MFAWYCLMISWDFLFATADRMSLNCLIVNYKIILCYVISLFLIVSLLNLLGKNPSPMWDRLVFNKIKAKLGGRVRFMASGASPLSPDVMEFLKM